MRMTKEVPRMKRLLRFARNDEEGRRHQIAASLLAPRNDERSAEGDEGGVRYYITLCVRSVNNILIYKCKNTIQ